MRQNVFLVVLLSCKMYFAFIYVCVQMNRHGTLIRCLITVSSVGNKTKHTYGVVQNKPDYSTIVDRCCNLFRTR